jgi:hypothetical protein
MTEMRTRNTSSGKGVTLTTLPPSFADCLEIWEPQPPVTLIVFQGLYNDCFTFTIEHVGTKISFTYVFVCRNEVFLTTGIVNSGHWTRKVVFTTKLLLTKWNNIPFGKSVRVFTILLSNVKIKLVLLLYLLRFSSESA